MKKKYLVLGAGLVCAFTAVAFAQQSEWQAKIQEDMDGYKSQLVSNCGVSEKLVMKWNGKLTYSPRESEKPDWNAVSTLCTAGLDILSQTCQSNGPVKAAAGKLKSITCTAGKGTLGYKLKGGELTFTVDPSYTKNNVSGQSTDLTAKMKKELDK